MSALRGRRDVAASGSPVGLVAAGLRTARTAWENRVTRRPRTGDGIDPSRRLARHGCGLFHGARPLKRLIQQQIENPLARRILAGEYKPGDRIVVDVDRSGEVYTFERDASAVQ